MRIIFTFFCKDGKVKGTIPGEKWFENSRICINLGFRVNNRRIVTKIFVER